jgi:hypothetical protein
MDETDALTTAIARWLTAVVPHLDPGQRRIISAMIKGGCDVAVEARLRKGTFELVALDDIQGRRTVLYRQDVEPLRPGGCDRAQARHPGD